MYLNAISASVSPVQVSGHPVHSNAIWVVDLRGNQHHGIASINVGSSDSPNLIVCPINITLDRVIVYSYGMPYVVNLYEQRNNDQYMRVQQEGTDKCVFVCVCLPVALYQWNLAGPVRFSSGLSVEPAAVLALRLNKPDEIH